MSITHVKSFEERFRVWAPHFSRYRAYLKARHKTLKPQKIYCRVEKFWSWLKSEEILPSELEPVHFLRYYRALRGGELCLETERYSKSSLVIFLNHALTWTSYLVKTGVLLSDPFEGLVSGIGYPRNIYTSSLTKSEVQEILQAPDLTVAWGLRNQAILEIIYGSGLRRGEVISLTLDSLDLGERLLNLRDTKNGWDRCVPMTRSAAESLGRYLMEGRPLLQGPQTGNNLWLTYHRGVLTKDSLTSIAHQLGERTGIKFTLHGLRHACATHLLEGGAKLRHIAELLGHENLETTSYYAKSKFEELRKVHQKTHPRG